MIESDMTKTFRDYARSFVGGLREGRLYNWGLVTVLALGIAGGIGKCRDDYKLPNTVAGFIAEDVLKSGSSFEIEDYKTTGKYYESVDEREVCANLNEHKDGKRQLLLSLMRGDGTCIGIMDDNLDDIQDDLVDLAGRSIQGYNKVEAEEAYRKAIEIVLDSINGNGYKETVEDKRYSKMAERVCDDVLRTGKPRIDTSPFFPHIKWLYWFTKNEIVGASKTYNIGDTDIEVFTRPNDPTMIVNVGPSIKYQFCSIEIRKGRITEHANRPNRISLSEANKIYRNILDRLDEQIGD